MDIYALCEMHDGSNKNISSSSFSSWPNDVVYKLNKTGPRTDPCGTPNGRCCGQDMLIL